MQVSGCTAGAVTQADVLWPVLKLPTWAPPIITETTEEWQSVMLSGPGASQSTHISGPLPMPFTVTFDCRDCASAAESGASEANARKAPTAEIAIDFKRNSLDGPGPIGLEAARERLRDTSADPRRSHHDDSAHAPWRPEFREFLGATFAARLRGDPLCSGDAGP